MKLTIKYDSEKDATTYINFIRNFNSFKHGRNNIQDRLLNSVSPILRDIIIEAETDEDAYTKILEHLDKNHKDEPNLLNDSISKFRETWESVGTSIIYNLEYLYRKPFQFNEITAYITTNSIFPYNYDEKYYFVTHKYLSAQLETSIHELNHFMFYQYYPFEEVGLELEEYELLKEALTIFTNPTKPGKPNELPLRDFIRSKVWSDLDDVIRECVTFLKGKSPFVD